MANRPQRGDITLPRRQRSVRRSDATFADIEPTYDFDQSISSVQRLIDQFQTLDARDCHVPNNVYANEEYVKPFANGYASRTGYVSDDVTTRDYRSRGYTHRPAAGANASVTYADARPRVRTSFRSASDIPQAIANSDDFREYNEVGHFRRRTPTRQSAGAVENPAVGGGGYFGVRLSQRKPQIGRASCRERV